MDDLIRREDAVEMLRENARGYTVSMFSTIGECYVAKVVAIECAVEVKNLPAANADPQWISVANKLPETDDPVLCYYLGKDGKHHCSVGYHERYGSYAEAWYVEVECNCAGYGCERVSHWMPLPEPPKMDGGKDNEKAAD